MANKIKGITVKIGGDTIDLNRALKDVNKNSASLNSELNQINRQLKFDPSSAVLLSQKQDVLRDSISAAKDKLKELEAVQDDIERQYKNGDIDDGKYRAFQREVEQTKSKLNSYEGQLKTAQTAQTDFSKKIEQSKEKLDSVKRSLSSGIKTAGKWAAATGAAAVTGIIKVAEEASEKLDTVDKMSQKIGVSRQTYQELDFVFSQFGTNVDGLKNGLKTLRSVMDTTAQGTSKNKTALEELGISAIDVSGNLRDSEDVMWETFKTLQGMENQTKKARLATKLFGKAGLELMPMLNGSAGSVENLRKKAHKLGLVLDNETIDKGVEFKDTLDQTKRALSAVGTELGAAFMPAMVRVMRKVQDKMPEIRKMVEGFGKKVENDIEWFIDNGDTVIKLVKAAGIEIAGIYTAIKANRAVKSISETISAFRTLTSATAAQKAATVAATAATEAETVAQTGLNVAMSANVIGAVVSGLIVLGSTLWAICSTTEDAEADTVSLTKAQQELVDTIHADTEEMKSLGAERKKTISSIDSEYDHYRDLSGELDKIVDKNGKVKRKDKERAEFIMNELSEALGIEFKWNGKIIQNYKDITNGIDEVIRKKELLAQQEAYEGDYKEAIKKDRDLHNRYIEAETQYTPLYGRLGNIYRLRESAIKKRNKYDQGTQGYLDATSEINALDAKIKKLQPRLDTLREAYTEAESNYLDNLSLINNYKKFSAAILSDNEEQISDSLLKLQYSFVTAKEGTKSALQDQVEILKKELSRAKKAVKDGVVGVSDETVKGIEKLLDQAIKEYDKKGGYANAAGKKLARQFVDGYISGLDLSTDSAREEQLALKARDIPAKTEKYVAERQDSHSPSRVAMKYGGYWPEGYVIGFAEKAKAVREKLRAAAESMQSPVEAAAVTPSFSGNLKTLSSGGRFVQSSYKTYNNTPVINVNFGDVSVRDDSDIDALADMVSVKIVDSIILKGVANGD